MLAVDVVVPVFNRWELTESCLNGLKQQTHPHTVYVVDNGSADGTPERLREQFPEAHVVALAQNRGFSAACNRGAREGTGDVVVLLNNDVECPADFLERLIAPLSGEAGSVSALLLQPDEKRIESFGLAVDPTLAGYPRLRGEPRTVAQAEAPVLIGPSGAAGAYRRQAWEDVGGLDEGVFAYAEDVDLALRLRAAGWEAVAAGRRKHWWSRATPPSSRTISLHSADVLLAGARRAGASASCHRPTRSTATSPSGRVSGCGWGSTPQRRHRRPPSSPRSSARR